MDTLAAATNQVQKKKVKRDKDKKQKDAKVGCHHFCHQFIRSND